MEGLIEIENPNRMAQKSKKVTQIELDEPKQLSRRERCVLILQYVEEFSVVFSSGYSQSKIFASDFSFVDFFCLFLF